MIRREPGFPATIAPPSATSPSSAIAVPASSSLAGAVPFLLILCLPVLFLLPAEGTAQGTAPSVSALRIPLVSERWGSDGAVDGVQGLETGTGQTPGEPSGPGPATSFLASLVLPGSAQWMHGQDRTYLYAALEVAGWIGYLHERHQGSDYRIAYRDLAGTYALVDGSEEGAAGDFSFYETMGRYVSSGAWDADPAKEGLQPETDPDTYNGMIWSLASDLYLPGGGGSADPEAAREALLYYQERAYPPEQAWDWSGNTRQMERYGDLIEKSDESFRTATVILGAVVANHLLSAVDGFLSTRLSSDRSLRLSSAPDPGGRTHHIRWIFELRLNPTS